MPKNKQFPPIRMTQNLLNAIKGRAEELSLPRAQFVRLVVERAALVPLSRLFHFLYGEKMDK